MPRAAGAAVSGGVLLAQADSIAQRLAYDAAPHGGWRAEFAGRVRAATLYSTRFALLDAQVFDGPILLELGPMGLLEMLGASPGTDDVVVLMRASSAAVAAERLRGGEDFISQVHHRDPVIVAEQIQRWADAIDSGVICSRTWPPSSEFPFAERLVQRLRSVTPALVAEDRFETLIAAPTRSRMLRLLHGTAATGPSGSPLTDGQRRVLARWWEDAYTDTLAAQHGLTGVDFEARDDEEIAAESEKYAAFGRPRERKTVVRLSARVLDHLTEFGPAQFAALRADVRPIVRRDSSHRNPIARYQLAHIILVSTFRPSPVLDALFLVVRVVAWAALVLALVDGALPPGVAALLVVLGTLAQVPLDDVKFVAALLGRRNRTIIWQPGL